MFVPYRFADFWRQEELSDVTVEITAPDRTTLTQLPGHGIILSQSPYCRAQILRWQSDNSARRASRRSSRAGNASGAAADASTAGQPAQPPGAAALLASVAPHPGPASAGPHGSPAAGDADAMDVSTAAEQGGQHKPRLVLTLQDSAEEPAAVAVLAALYGVKPIPELLSELPQEQQLHAALLADMWQVPGVSTAAVQLLVAAATADQGLSEAAYNQFLQLAAPPSCLLPLFQVLVGLLAQQGISAQQTQATLKRMLLSVLGDLEEVWADEALLQTLLRLPLSAMVKLLGCDELKVASEDTVLYTAERYAMGFNTNPQHLQAAQQLLAPMVRAQHLSQFWLAAAVLSPSAPTLLGVSYSAQLRQLLMLKAGVGNSALHGPELQQLIPGAPDSWQAGQRTIRAAPAVEVLWKLDIGTVSSAVDYSVSQQRHVTLDSPATSAPIGGLAFGIQVVAEWRADTSVTNVYVYAVAKNAPAGTFHKFQFKINVAGGSFGPVSSNVLAGGTCTGWLMAGPMAGGWDAAVWTQADLPSAGELVLKLKVSKVAHSW